MLHPGVGEMRGQTPGTGAPSLRQAAHPGHTELQAARHMHRAKGKNQSKKGQKSSGAVNEEAPAAGEVEPFIISQPCSFFLPCLSSAEGDCSLQPSLPSRAGNSLLGARNGPIKSEIIKHSWILVLCINSALYTERRRKMPL